MKKRVVMALFAGLLSCVSISYAEQAAVEETPAAVDKAAVAEDGKWDAAGDEISEAAKAVGDATVESSKEIWDATKEGSVEAWDVTKEKTHSLWEKGKAQLHDATEPEPAVPEGD